MELGSSPRPLRYSNCWWPAFCLRAARVLFPVLQLLEVSPTAFSSFAIFIIQWPRVQRRLCLLSGSSSLLKGGTAPTKRPWLPRVERAPQGFGDAERTLSPSRKEEGRRLLAFSGRKGSTCRVEGGPPPSWRRCQHWVRPQGPRPTSCWALSDSPFLPRLAFSSSSPWLYSTRFLVYSDD